MNKRRQSLRSRREKGGSGIAEESQKSRWRAKESKGSKGKSPQRGYKTRDAQGFTEIEKKKK